MNLPFNLQDVEKCSMDRNNWNCIIGDIKEKKFKSVITTNAIGYLLVGRNYETTFAADILMSDLSSVINVVKHLHLQNTLKITDYCTQVCSACS